MVTRSHTVQAIQHLPLLETGDHLDQTTFHERYKAMPASFSAELIAGVVRAPSPLPWGHGVYRALAMGWLTNYWLATPGTQLGDNATAIFGEASEPQPDGVLIIHPSCGGQTSLSADGYLTGPPELIVEIASSSAAIDLHTKRGDYEQAGVLEYVVAVVHQRILRWFVLQDGTYQEVSPDTDGIFQSQVFPGLWLHANAFWQLDGGQVMDVLRQGLTTPEHDAFVQQLQERRTIPPQ